jgi:hypothetical protein
LTMALAGLGAVSVIIHRNSVEHRVAALRAAGYPTSLAEFVEDNRLPDGTQNAANVYERALAAYVPPANEANTPLLGTARMPDRGLPLSEAMTKALLDCLARNQECLSLLHEAGMIGQCRYGWDWRPDTGGLQLGAVRHCGMLLELRGIYDAYGGDPNAVIGCIRDGLRLADSLRQEPTLISYFVRIACIAFALRDLERSLSLTFFTEEQLRELNDALTSAGETLSFVQALVAERCCLIETCRDPSLMSLYRQNTLSRKFPGEATRALQDVLDCMGDYIEAAELPPLQRAKRFREIATKVSRRSFLPRPVRSMPPAGMSRVSEIDLRIRAHLDLARTALALERQRLVTRELPECLEELVPWYLPQVPVDPFDGKPIRYRRRQPGYLLYSVAEDGQDNGGQERDDVKNGEPYDWCFIVTR